MRKKAGNNKGDVDKKGLGGVTPLMQACYKGDIKKVRRLIKQGADVSAVDENLNTSLMYAVWSGPEIIKLLIFYGADPKAVDLHKSTALHIAAHYRTALIAVSLIKAGADINAVDSWGRPPVELARLHSNSDVFRELIILGADLSLKDESGQTIIERVLNMENGNDKTKFVEILKKHAPEAIVVAYMSKNHGG